MAYTKKGKFSYSKLNVYNGCGFRFYLQYKAGHFVNVESIAIDLGVLIHRTEEMIFNAFKEGRTPDYEKLKEEFYTINIPKKDQFDTEGGIFGLNILKEKYKEEFYQIDENGHSYYTKTLDYLSHGIYRLENYLKENPDLIPYGAEQYYAIDYNGYFLNGFIDRIFYNTKTKTYIIEDIKTKGKPFKDKELTTPLQLAIYTMGLSKQLDIPEDHITCVYDLPLCDIKQVGGTPGFMNRARKQMDKLFAGIDAQDYAPNQTPLCHFCAYCRTNPEAPENTRNLCPYHSLWTRDSKTYVVANSWTGMENYEKVLEKYIANNTEPPHNNDDEFDF